MESSTSSSSSAAATNTAPVQSTSGAGGGGRSKKRPASAAEVDLLLAEIKRRKTPPTGFKDQSWEKRKKGTLVWEYFWIATANKQVKCKACNAVLAYSGGSTSTMRNHATNHGLPVDPPGVNTQKKAPQKTAQPTINLFAVKTDDQKFNPQTNVGYPLARMAAKDNISLNTLANSEDIQEGLKARNFFHIPTSRQGVRNKIMDIYKYERDCLKKLFQERMAQGERFSVTLDEATAKGKKKYMNVNVHSFHQNKLEVFNLGVYRVRGKCPAEAALKHLQSKLAVFGLNINSDIVGVTTDGAAVMKKMGRLHEAEHFLCQAHAINLAVTDHLYEKEKARNERLAALKAAAAAAEAKRAEEAEAAGEEPGNASRTIPGTAAAAARAAEDMERQYFQEEDEEEMIDPDDDDAAELEVQRLVRQEDALADAERCASLSRVNDGDDDEDFDLDIHLTPAISKVISKIRKCVTFIRRSSINLDSLRDICDKDGVKLDSLPLDCPTRWNSLAFMMRRFLKVKNQIQKCLIDLKAMDKFLSTDEIKLAREVLKALDYMELAVKAFSNQELYLSGVEASATYIVNGLRKEEQKGNQMAGKIAQSFFDRINLRRVPEMSGLVHYLSDPSSYRAENPDDLFTFPAKARVLIPYACKLIKRLFLNRIDPPTNTGATNDAPVLAALAQEDDDDDDDFEVQGKAFFEMLAKKTKKIREDDDGHNVSCHLNRNSPDFEINLSVSREFNLLESTGSKGPHLHLLYNALRTIAPTSVEAERAFSAMNLFKTKMRSSLGDDTLDALCFLREHFRRAKQAEKEFRENKLKALSDIQQSVRTTPSISTNSTQDLDEIDVDDVLESAAEVLD